MPDKPASLYSRLGGYDAIAAVVDAFGLVPAASIPITANANWLSIL
jgi:hypothetical protein